ncbi:hypothetical protein BFR04_06825 [Gaetbulibacter sp. 4G1]|nr:hypothetical protein [Gaetbulibacter sp. 4G1]PIA79226.1 hypothetical protein BFR04_06825 [Gaetbulibacter sp. 4G1]
MGNSLNIKYNDLGYNLWQSLLINSEAIKKNGLNGKMSFVYFLFKYAKEFSKEYYSQFAFEILEGVLIEELSGDEVDKSFYSSVSGIGWGLMRLIEEDFFESDDTNEILSIIDEKIYKRIDDLLNKELSLDDFEQLILLGAYLNKRIFFLEESRKVFLLCKNKILVVNAKIVSNIKHVKKKGFKRLVMMKIFFENSFVSDLYLNKGLTNLDIIEKQLECLKIKETYFSYIKSEDYASAVVIDLLFSKEIKAIEKNRKSLLQKIETVFGGYINAMYCANVVLKKDVLVNELIILIGFIYGRLNFKKEALFMLGLIRNNSDVTLID